MRIKYLNLKRMFNYILLNVPEENLNMSHYRHYTDRELHKCGSVGCVIGHCTILDDYENIPKYENGELNFLLWSKQFTDIDYLSKNWEWCFGANWPNDKEQILLRIKYLIDNKKVPKLWYCNYSYKLLVEKLEPYKI